MLRIEPHLPFRKYRIKSGMREVYAMPMPDDFEIRSDSRKIDQRKAGARQMVQYVSVLSGKAGDYIYIRDPDTGSRGVYDGATFERAFIEVLDKVD